MKPNIEKIKREIAIQFAYRAEFCRQSGIKESTLGMILLKGSTTNKRLTQIAKALGIDGKDLLSN